MSVARVVMELVELSLVFLACHRTQVQHLGLVTVHQIYVNALMMIHL
jgi:hypothetical protein